MAKEPRPKVIEQIHITIIPTTFRCYLFIQTLFILFYFYLLYFTVYLILLFTMYLILYNLYNVRMPYAKKKDRPLKE